MKIWYNEIKEFYMQKFIQAYIEKLDVTTIIENILTKVISLLLLLIVFYIAKKMLHTPNEVILFSFSVFIDCPLPFLTAFGLHGVHDPEIGTACK